MCTKPMLSQLRRRFMIQGVDEETSARLAAREARVMANPLPSRNSGHDHHRPENRHREAQRVEEMLARAVRLG